MRFFFENRHAFLKKVCFSQYLSIFCVFTHFGKHQILTKTHLLKRACRFPKKKCLRPPERRKQLLGLPIHIKYQLILIHIGYYIKNIY